MQQDLVAPHQKHFTSSITCCKKQIPGPANIRLKTGILYLTSETFRKFVKDLADNPTGNDCLVEIDMKANVVRTSSSLHKPVQYRLVFHDVFRATYLSAHQPRKSIPIKNVMLAAFQACTRLQWFDIALESKSLLELIQSLDEVVHVASRSQPPLSVPPVRPSHARASY